MKFVNKLSYEKYHRDSDYLENEKLFKNMFLMRYKLISKFIKNKGKVLEIGCSTGFFLDVYKEHGWQTFGVEPSDSARAAAAKGHKIWRKYFEETDLPKNYFDLVIMNHTLEHVADSERVLKKIHSLLKINGTLFIDVPNAGGLGSKILGKAWPLRLPKEHNYQFTKGSLTKMITDAGYKVLHWESRSGIFEFANPSAELWLSLVTFKKRFFVNLLLFPYSFLATVFKMGDSMSVISVKK